MPSGRINMNTLRTRLLVRTMVAMTLVLVAAGAAVFLFVRASLLAELDQSLLAAARLIESDTEQDATGVKFQPELVEFTEYSRAKKPDYFQAWLDGGAVAGRSPSLGGQSLSRPALSDDHHPKYAFMRLPDGREGRQVAVRYVPATDDEDRRRGPTATRQTVTLVVARHTAPFEEKLESLAWLLAGVCGAAVIAAGATLLAAVSRGLRPLEDLARRIATVGHDNLADPIELRDAPGEMTAVVMRLNELLARLNAALERERGFTADVAHELRTPLAGLEAVLDVCATRDRTTAEYRKAVATCQSIARSMHAMVDNLLLLARADAGQLVLAPSMVDMASLISECWATFAPRAESRRLDVRFAVPDDLCLSSDAEKLAIVVRNLFDNAVSYCDEGGRIDVEVAPSSGGVDFRCRNTGSRVSPEDAGRATDRFWRGDASRTGGGAHVGLGLSLCRKIAEVLGGRLAIRSTAQGIFEASLWLKADAVATPGDADAILAGRGREA